jgi:hypothetical protein
MRRKDIDLNLNMQPFNINWFLEAGYRILDTGYLLLDARCWMKDEIHFVKLDDLFLTVIGILFNRCRINLIILKRIIFHLNV